MVSYPSFNLYLLEWIGLIPLLFAIEGKSLRQAYLFGLITGLVAVGGGGYWMANWADLAFNVPFPLNVLFVIGFAFCFGQVFGVVTFVFQWLRQYKPIPEVLLFPIVQVSVFSMFPMLFDFYLGDAQSYFPAAIQGIEFTGVYGIDFVISLVNIIVFNMIRWPKEPIYQPILIGCLAILIAWFGYGVWALSQWDADLRSWPKKRIGIIQPNRHVTLSRPIPESGYSRIFPLEMGMSRDLAEKGAEIVFWPEGHFYGYAYWSAVREAFKKHVQDMAIPVVFYDSTYKKINRKKYLYNTSLLIDNNGELTNTYYKVKLVPFSEYSPIVGTVSFIKNLLGDFLDDLTPGQHHKTFKAAGMRIVPKICYEPLFPGFIAEAIGNDADGKVLLVQSQDGWFGKSSQPELHVAISALRAVENRVPLVHVINNGASAVILPNGRRLFRSKPFVRGAWVVDMPYDIKKGGSFYSRYPWLFINFIRGISFILILYSLNLLRLTRKRS